MAGHHVDWQEIAAIKLLAVGGQGVDFVGSIRAPDKAASAGPASIDTDRNDMPVVAGPLALDAHQLATDFDGEIVRAMLR